MKRGKKVEKTDGRPAFPPPLLTLGFYSPTRESPGRYGKRYIAASTVSLHVTSRIRR